MFNQIVENKNEKYDKNPKYKNNNFNNINKS